MKEDIELNKAAKEYASKEYTRGLDGETDYESIKDTFIIAVKSDAARGYWNEQQQSISDDKIEKLWKKYSGAWAINNSASNYTHIILKEDFIKMLKEIKCLKENSSV